MVAGFACRISGFLPPFPEGEGYPPDPRSQSALPRRGRGRPKLFYARGFAPCIPGAGRGAALGKEANHAPGGGRAPYGAGGRGHPGARRGCLPSLPPAYPAFAFFSAPYPPTPFPGGEGGDQSYFMQGASPLASPGLGGARHWGRGRTTRRRRACPLQGGVRGASRCPAGGVPGWLSAVPDDCFLFCPHPPDPLPGGKGEIFVCFAGGYRPRHPCS